MRPTIAILPWGDAIEDYLDPLGLSLEDFRDEMAGGWLFGYAQALATAGVEAQIVCCSRRVRSVARWRHAATGAPLVVLPVPRAARAVPARLRRPYASYLSTPLRLLGRETRRAGWRAVLCQEYEYPRFDATVALGRLLGVPVFATFQGGTAPDTRFERVVRRLTVPAAAGLLIASDAEAERVRGSYGVPAGRISPVPNPLDVRLWSGPARDRAGLGIPDGAVLVAWHGRVVLHEKGLDVLLDAWRRLAERPDLPARHLLLVGTGPDAGTVREHVRALPGVTWIDRYVLAKPELAELLAMGDLYAFPSRHEGFPVAPLEAMASGLPLVAAAAPGIAEILPAGEGSGGVVVAPGDAGAFAAALARLLSDAGLRERLGERARHRVREAFSLEAVGAELSRTLLAQRRGSASRHVRRPAR